VAVPLSPIVGITGAPAAGKSAFARRLSDLGAAVIDVDALGHDALARPRVRDAVVQAFGASALASDGSLDRRALARIAFASDAARVRLEGIVHPVVRQALAQRIDAARASGAPLVALDCALLFEGGLDGLCDLVVAVDAPEPLRLARAQARHGWDADEVARRMRGQLPAEEKRARADRVVVNDGDESRLEDEARAVFEELGREAPARRRGR
jgi:dephospho-CoA kinase